MVAANTSCIITLILVYKSNAAVIGLLVFCVDCACCDCAGCSGVDIEY